MKFVETSLGGGLIERWQGARSFWRLGGMGGMGKTDGEGTSRQLAELLFTADSEVGFPKEGAKEGAVGKRLRGKG